MYKLHLLKLTHYFMTSEGKKRKAWTGEAAVWLLTAHCVITGTKFNNQTAENLAACLTAQHILNCIPVHLNWLTQVVPNAKYGAILLSRQRLTPNQQHGNIAAFVHSIACFSSSLPFSCVVRYLIIKLLCFILCQNLWHCTQLLQVSSNWLSRKGKQNREKETLLELPSNFTSLSAPPQWCQGAVWRLTGLLRLSVVSTS